jgi:NAD+ kinase
MRTVALVVHDEKDQAIEVAGRLAGLLKEMGIRAISTGEDAPLEEVEAVIGVGGDGTVLRAARLALRRRIPIAGVNVGRVGYLAEFEIDELALLAEAIAGNHLQIIDRMTVEVTCDDTTVDAVNDVVIEKVLSQRIIEIAVTINGRRFARYRTDGLIVATPAGSTAYSLSAGGPVVDPEVDALVLTPVAPHSLLSRSLILAPEAVISVTVEIDRPARVNVDGREVCLVEPGRSVEVRRGAERIRFLTLGRHPFPQAVRHQFGLDHA